MSTDEAEKLVNDYERVVMERSQISVFSSHVRARNAEKHADIRGRLVAALLREGDGERWEVWLGPLSLDALRTSKRLHQIGVFTGDTEYGDRVPASLILHAPVESGGGG